MYTVGLYADRDHVVYGLFTGRKVRGFPPDVGDCIVGQVEDVPAEVISMVKQICKDLKYQGIAEFEFKRDSMTGCFKLIEINPRSWSWVGITPFCGASLPWIAYSDLIGAAVVSDNDGTLVDGEVKWVRILEDLPNCLYRNRRLGYPQWHMTPRQWWQSLRANKLVIAEFSVDDPLPGLYSIYYLVRKVVLRLLRRLQ